MNNFNIINKIINNITCPVCKRRFKAKEVRIRNITDNLLIFNAQCSNNHEPVQSIFITTVPMKKDNKINNIKKQLDNFDGDFIKLWKK